MRIYELLNAGQPEAPTDANGGIIQPTAVAPPPMQQQPPLQQPQQQAGLWDMAKDFMSTPQPIGGPAPKPGPAAPTPPGQPPAQSSGMINRPFGGSAIGQNLDAINKGLQQPTTPGKPPGTP